MEKELLKYQETLQMALGNSIIKGHGMKIKCKVTEYTSTPQGPFTSENGAMASTTGKESINSQTELFMKVNGRSTWCMEPGFTLTKWEQGGRGSTETGNSKQKDKSNCSDRNK